MAESLHAIVNTIISGIFWHLKKVWAFLVWQPVLHLIAPASHEKTNLNYTTINAILSKPFNTTRLTGKNTTGLLYRKLLKPALRQSLLLTLFLGLANTGLGQDTLKYTTAGTYSFTVPEEVTSITVEAWGGGAGGGNDVGNGGGGGAYAASVISVTPDEVYNIIVGSGGSSGGGNGENTIFGSDAVLAAGAQGQTGGLAGDCEGNVAYSGGNGGSGGSNSGGGGGGSALPSADGNTGGDGSGNTGGTGGIGYGNGGDGGRNKEDGGDGSSPGGGGGGAGNNSTGGVGADGRIVVTYSTLPTVNFETVTTNQTEADITIFININLTSSSSSDVTIPFSISGSSTANGDGNDYTLNSNSPLTIPAGNTSTSISISIISDDEIEEDETIIIELDTPTNAVLGIPNTHTVTIIDDDFDDPSLTVSSSVICLGDDVTFTAIPPTGDCAHVDTFYYSSDNTNWTEIPTVTFTSVDGNCISTYTPPNAGTFYYRYYYYKNPGNNGYSNSVAITVNPLPQGSLSANGPFCGSGNGQLKWTATTGTGPFTVVYNDGITNRTKTGVVSGTPFDVEINPVDSTTTYTLVSVTDANGCTRESNFTNDEATITVNKFNMAVSDATPTPSGAHCPEFLDPFNANTDSYNPGVTEVIFKVTKEQSTTGTWTFDFEIDETGDVEVYDLVSVAGNNSAITYSDDDAGGNLDAGDNTEVTFTFHIVNVPGTSLDVEFTVSNGNDGVCDETGSEDDNSEIHTINVMPVIGSFNP